MCLVDLVRHMWRTEEISQELGWKIIFLITKGITDTIGIRLLETLWKVVEVLINTRLRGILYIHYFLHGFRSMRGTGTAIMELNISQALDSIYQCPLFLVFLELWKAYDTVDRDRLFITLEGY